MYINYEGGAEVQFQVNKKKVAISFLTKFADLLNSIHLCLRSPSRQIIIPCIILGI